MRRRRCCRWRSTSCRGDALLLAVLRARGLPSDEGIGRKRYSRARTGTLAAVSGPETTVELLREVAAEHPDRAAFVELDRRLTFAEWDRAADGVAAFFADAACGPGDVVALLVPSSIDYAVCYQAAMRLRAITTGINTRLGPPEIASILDRTQPRVVIRDADLDAVRAAYARRPARRPPARRARRPGRDRLDEWHHRHAEGRGVRPSQSPRGRDRRGRDGCAASTCGSRRSRSRTSRSCRGRGRRSRTSITTVITPTPWTAADALQLMARERVTVGQGVPTQWRLVLDHPDFAASDLSTSAHRGDRARRRCRPSSCARWSSGSAARS